MTSARKKPKAVAGPRRAAPPVPSPKGTRFASPKQAKMARYVIEKYEKALRDLAK
jgi:hypothetical protein